MPRKRELARMTPEQLQRKRDAHQAYKKRRRAAMSPEQAAIARRNRNSDQFVDRRIAKQIAKDVQQAERREEAARAVVSDADRLALYHRVRVALPRRLAPDERDEAASMLFLAVLEGQAPLYFGEADIDAALSEMDDINGLTGWTRKLPLDEVVGDRTRGQAMGLC